MVFVMFVLPLSIQAQTLIKPQYGPGEPEVVEHYATTTLDNGEVVPWFPIEEVVVYARRTFKTEDDRQKYLRLRRNVIRVLPYAIYAQKRYEQLDRDLAMTNSRREEKRLIKECEQEIKDKITSEVKNLSVSQGKILIKLIERQTGNTSYELVKDMKGGISAFVYQGVAKIFGHNLKSTYDPTEDYEIENIIREYERSRPMAKP
ncbi:DUF4294 domain-containing protein [Sphingobacterium sp. 1.A.5]|uniref:DUF4294 domain-containing protein n=1 Tax=Sphingobacterium sp. 1.A.5 TaxID=2044604 RepID=UPI00211F053B|nr:DUF4294 domain-containing protein [Sphingobacterium sp. 1.A.5]